MSPEYGATCGFFPVDERDARYLRLTGRSAERIALVEAYCKENLLWHDPEEEPTYSQVVELDLGDVEPSLAGPRRPQDRVPLRGEGSFLAQLETFGVDYAAATRRSRRRSRRATRPSSRRRSGGAARGPSPVAVASRSAIASRPRHRLRHSSTARS